MTGSLVFETSMVTEFNEVFSGVYMELVRNVSETVSIITIVCHVSSFHSYHCVLLAVPVHATEGTE
jgi:hypothetical protein